MVRGGPATFVQLDTTVRRRKHRSRHQRPPPALLHRGRPSPAGHLPPPNAGFPLEPAASAGGVSSDTSIDTSDQYPPCGGSVGFPILLLILPPCQRPSPDAMCSSVSPRLALEKRRWRSRSRTNSSRSISSRSSTRIGVGWRPMCQETSPTSIVKDCAAC